MRTQILTKGFLFAAVASLVFAGSVHAGSISVTIKFSGSVPTPKKFSVNKDV